MGQERTFTTDEIIDIIGKSESLRQYDYTKKTLQESGLIRRLSGEITLSMQAIFDIAKAEGIKIIPQYVDEVIRKFYPSEEMQIETLKKHNAKPDKETVIKLYSQEIIKELLRFRNSYEDYFSKSYYEDGVQKGVHIFRFCKPQRPKKREIADLYFYFYCTKDSNFNLNLSMKVNEQSFFDRCGELIIGLNEQITKTGYTMRKYEVTHKNADIIKSY